MAKRQTLCLKNESHRRKNNLRKQIPERDSAKESETVKAQGQSGLFKHVLM